MPPSLSYGLNLPSKKQPPGASGQKRKKTVFDDDSDEEDQDNKDGEVEISTVGGVEEPSQTQSQPPKKPSEELPSKRKPLFMTGGKKPGKPGAKPLSKNSIFADDEDEDGTEDNAQQEQLDSGGLPLGLNAPKSQQKPTDPSKDYTNLSAMHSSKKHAQEAQELDPSIYSYDAIYDSLHAKPDKASTSATKASEGPKYMASLLRSAEVRKRDQLRARDRMLTREREAEGDEFADKEKFVTSAYKAQQEEMRRVEQEDAEKERQEEERRRRNGGMGMVGFYRDMLSRDEQKHGESLKAAEKTAQRIKTGQVPDPATAEGEEKAATEPEDEEAKRAADLNAKGAHIAVNDEGQVVDKRQLLSAGLNVAPKPKSAPSAASAASSRAPGAGSGAGKQRSDPNRGGQRARQTEMIAAQLEERAQQGAQAEEARQQEVAEKNRSRKTEGEVSSAKERYLARKREREAQAGK